MSDWLPMFDAPQDGTEIELLLHHPNRAYCTTDDERARWTAIVKAKWIDFNSGGWTWRGMFGRVIAWRPIAPIDAATSGSAPSGPEGVREFSQ